MIRARVCCGWTGAGTRADPRRPAVLDDHRPQSAADVTGTPAVNLPPTPNLVVIEGTWDDTTWAALLADAGYGPGSVLWSETV